MDAIRIDSATDNQEAVDPTPANSVVADVNPETASLTTDAIVINAANSETKNPIPFNSATTDAQLKTADPITSQPVITGTKQEVTTHPLQELIHKENGIDALIICGENPKKAVICFSSMNPGKYERWSWFYEKHKAGSDDLYVILKDDDHRYYIGNDLVSMHVRHRKFITELLTKHKLSSDQLYMVGSSMGGYAAIYFGFLLNAAGIVSINPQIDYQSSRRHTLQNWERKIREIGSNWVDLNDFIYRFKHKPKVHIEHGDYPADVSAAEKFVASLSEMKISYTREFTGGDHSATTINRHRLFDIIDFWSK